MDKTRILIVEDDLDLADMLDAYFSVQNYDVLKASWGEDALKISNEQTVDLIMLDIRLPDINGYEVCRRLRSQRRTQDVPIIFLTEKRDRVDKLQGLELGVVDYITKPFDIQELRLRVRNAIVRAERQSLVNPVTELPETQLVDERLTQMIYGEGRWSLLLVSMGGLGELRDVYGFVAADEVLRAVTLMVRNAVREYGNDDDLIGHYAPEDLLIVTTAERAANIRDRIENRIRQSLEHFYPPKAREAMETHHLKLTTRALDYSAGSFNDLDALKAALQSAEARE